MNKFQNTNLIKVSITILSFLFIFSTCRDKIDPPVEKYGKISFSFKHLIDGQPILYDTLMYQNAAGNPYLVSEIQYFITNVTLYQDGKSPYIIDDWEKVHYVDTDLEETWTWEVFDKLPIGDYDSIAFTFGFPDQENISFAYVNPPERDMFWPEFLGGGYHYLKLNGKWLAEGQTNIRTPFDFHMGRGQIYYSYPDSITGFVDNSFRITLPNSSFTLVENKTKQINLNMNVNKWFDNPYIFDLNATGGYIMQSQEYMNMAKENGVDVFSVEF